MQPGHEALYRAALSIATTVDHAVDGPGFTIPVDYAMVESQPAVVQPLVFNALDGKLDSYSAFLVHLRVPAVSSVRASILIYLAKAIDQLLARLPDDPTRIRAILLLPTLPADGDDVRSILDAHISSGRLVLLSEGATSLPGGLLEDPARRSALATVLANLQPSALDRLQDKMVRRLGHFIRQLDGRIVRCARYFYDGTWCTAEVQELLIAELRSLSVPTRPPLLFHCPMSRWLGETVMACAEELNSTAHDLSQFLVSPTPPCPLDPAPVVVLDMVDTGQAIRNLFRHLRSWGLRGAPRVYSVMTTRSTDEAARVRQVVVDDQPIDVHYFMRVAQQVAQPPNCPQCKLGIVPTDPSPESDSGMLSAYDFWDLVGEVGLKPEDDVPPHRSSAGEVPKLPELVQRHGPWLASRLWRRLQRASNELPTDTLFVCPDQRGAQVLTDFLRLVVGAASIRIPRDDIDAVAAGAALAMTPPPPSPQPLWKVQLAKSTVAEVVVLDEFNWSGGTFHALTQLLLAHGKTVAAYACLADLNPSTSKDFGVPCYSLYEWQAATTGMPQTAA